MKPEFFEPGGSFYRHPLDVVSKRMADKNLGMCLYGAENTDGHGIYLYLSNQQGTCRKCDVPANYIIEETHHDGMPVSDSIAFLCRTHVPEQMWPEGD